jgi:alpha-L-fucosidase
MDAIVKPTALQAQWQDDEFGIFVHFGINTFNNKEWSDGTFPASSFNPTKLDCNQWVSVAKNAGAKYMILVCKHHDGFCNWQTATTDYSVKSSPWKGGKGDVVAEFVDACRKHGMKFGFYLSPWDRHEPKYTDKNAYDEFYAAQLTELVTTYANPGEIYELWFDGAGSTGRVYNWSLFMDIVRKHQPNAMIFNMGDLTIRWVGNESGYAPYPHWNVVESKNADEFALDGKTKADGSGDKWLPAECDVPIRHRHWFHHKGLWGILYRKMLFKKDKLVELYERSVGHGANLLLNLAPTEDGLFNQTDINRLSDAMEEVRRRYSTPLAKTSGHGKEVVLKLPEESQVSAVIIQEDILEGGERVRAYSLEAMINGTWRAVKPQEATISIGHKKIDKLFPPITTDTIKLMITESIADPLIRNFAAFRF